MFSVTIVKQGVISNGPMTFKTLEEANEWLAKEVANKSFGEPERWLSKEYAEKYALEITKKTPTREVEGTDLEKPHTEYLFAADYEVGIEDITAKASAEKAERMQKEQKKSSAFGSLKTIDVAKLKTVDEIKPILQKILDILSN